MVNENIELSWLDCFDSLESYSEFLGEVFHKVDGLCRETFDGVGLVKLTKIRVIIGILLRSLINSWHSCLSMTLVAEPPRIIFGRSYPSHFLSNILPFILIFREPFVVKLDKFCICVPIITPVLKRLVIKFLDILEI